PNNTQQNGTPDNKKKDDPKAKDPTVVDKKGQETPKVSPSWAENLLAFPVKDKLMAERDGERLALIAWIRSAEPARKAAYDADALPMPAELAGKPLTS